MSPNMIVFVFTIFMSACGTLTALPTANCTQGFLACVVEKVQAAGQGEEDECQIGQKYARCVAEALSEAEQNGTCDTLSLLAYRHTQHQDVSAYTADCPGFEVPAYLQLHTECERRLAHCGNSAIRAHVAHEDGADGETCRHLMDLQQCMESISSAVCPEQNQVSDLLHAQLRDLHYQATCTDTTAMTAKPTSTTATEPTKGVAIAAETPEPQAETTERMPTPTPPSTTHSPPTTTPTGPAGNGNRNGGNPLTSGHHSQVVLTVLAILLCLWHR